MTADPLKILTKRFRSKSVLSAALLICYVAFSLVLFFEWVAPSLDGRTDKHIAADSSTYIYIAESIRAGAVPPYLIAALSSFPNTLWSPVLLALILKDPFAMVIADYSMFSLALILLARSFSFSLGKFMGLLFLNATTTISLISVNKEIIDLLAVSIFLFALRTRRMSILVFALLLALFNRFEVSVVMLVFILAMGRLNPWRRRRIVTLCLLTVALSVALPIVESKNLKERFEEASEGHTIVLLDSLEIHYLYGIAVLPKIAENLFGELIDVPRLGPSYFTSDPANSYILFLNNLATVVVLTILIAKRSFTVRSDLVYFAVIGCIIAAVSLVIQPRYFYFAYILLCLQAALKEQSEENLFPPGLGGRPKRGPSLNKKDVAFG